MERFKCEKCGQLSKRNRTWKDLRELEKKDLCSACLVIIEILEDKILSIGKNFPENIDRRNLEIPYEAIKISRIK
jgi:hypothetical protein